MRARASDRSLRSTRFRAEFMRGGVAGQVSPNLHNKCYVAGRIKESARKFKIYRNLPDKGYDNLTIACRIKLILIA